MSSSSSAITPFEEIGKYEELDPAYESKTYASYPYSINRILNSSPLKTMVSINGQMVEAIVDCGAATSVISASLCDRLNLKLTGDIVKVSPFVMNSRFDNKAIDNTRINQVSTVFKTKAKEQFYYRATLTLYWIYIMSSPGS